MQSNNQTLAPVNVYFKEAWTENVKMYKIYPDWTLNQFSAALKPLVAQDFDLELDEFEFVVIGQEEGEDDEVLAQSNTIKLRDIFNAAPSFYVRRT